MTVEFTYHGKQYVLTVDGLEEGEPLREVLSAAMLLRYALKEETAARAIEDACSKALEDGFRTPDLWAEGFQKANTESMTQAILDRI